MKHAYQRLPFPLRAHHLSRRLVKKGLKRDLAKPDLEQNLRQWLEWNLAFLCSRSRAGYAKGSPVIKPWEVAR